MTRYASWARGTLPTPDVLRRRVSRFTRGLCVKAHRIIAPRREPVSTNRLRGDIDHKLGEHRPTIKSKLISRPRVTARPERPPAACRAARSPALSNPPTIRRNWRKAITIRIFDTLPFGDPWSARIAGAISCTHPKTNRGMICHQKANKRFGDETPPTWF